MDFREPPKGEVVRRASSIGPGQSEGPGPDEDVRNGKDPARKKSRDGFEGGEPFPVSHAPYTTRGLVRIDRKYSKSIIRH